MTSLIFVKEDKMMKQEITDKHYLNLNKQK